jgi:DNA-binding NtrC family response regulator
MRAVSEDLPEKDDGRLRTDGATTTRGTTTSTGRESDVRLDAARPGLLLAWKPDDVAAADRAPVDAALRVGRDQAAEWVVVDPQLSRIHFQVSREDDALAIRDLDSRNGTFVNGQRLHGVETLADQDVIRAGRCVFVFNDSLPVLPPRLPGSAADFGLAGPFHSPQILSAADRAIRTGRHLLLEGESGVGKELVARAIHRLAFAAGPFVAHNCATFASEEEAETTIFGVARGVFTGVETRAGLLESADGGLLYLDELHNLRPRLQRSLLRFAEDGQFRRIGELGVRSANVRLLLGTNLPADQAMAYGSLATDLVARTHRLTVPPLARRRADVPAIFFAALRKALAARPPASGGLSTVDCRLPPESWNLLLDPAQMEMLALHEYSGLNVRLLEDLAASLVARLSEAEAQERRRLLMGLFAERFPRSLVLARHEAAARPSVPEPSAVPAGSRDTPPGDDADHPSHYDRHRERIVAAYKECGGNLSAIETLLRSRGLPVTRRWLAVFLERWGIRDRRKSAKTD